MPIQDRDLPIGTKLVARYKKETYHAEVVEGEERRRLCKLEDGKTFRSPSSAGTAITGKACNGWAFWSVATDEETPAQEASSEGESKAEEPEPKPRRFFRVPNQRGVPEGHVRYPCATCKRSFNAPMGAEPENCPEGHKPE